MYSVLVSSIIDEVHITLKDMEFLIWKRRPLSQTVFQYVIQVIYMSKRVNMKHFMGAAIDTESGGCYFRIMNSGVTS